MDTAVVGRVVAGQPRPTVDLGAPPSQPVRRHLSRRSPGGCCRGDVRRRHDVGRPVAVTHRQTGPGPLRSPDSQSRSSVPAPSRSRRRCRPCSVPHRTSCPHPSWWCAGAQTGSGCGWDRQRLVVRPQPSHLDRPPPSGPRTPNPSSGDGGRCSRRVDGQRLDQDPSAYRWTIRIGDVAARPGDGLDPRGRPATRTPAGGAGGCARTPRPSTGPASSSTCRCTPRGRRPVL